MIKASQYLEIPSSDTVIWRYMDFVTFCSLLTTGKIFFRRLDKYSDELEGTLPPKTKEELLKYRSAFDYSSSEGTEKWAAGVIENVEAYKEWTVANAWTISDVENYAMWKIYLRGNREGVAIKSTVGRLKESFTANGFEIYLGKVHYEGLKQEELNVYSVSTNKSSPYEFEKELRALILYQFTIPDDCDNTNRRIPK